VNGPGAVQRGTRPVLCSGLRCRARRTCGSLPCRCLEGGDDHCRTGTSRTPKEAPSGAGTPAVATAAATGKTGCSGRCPSRSFA
jgi:hypothetical protein